MLAILALVAAIGAAGASSPSADGVRLRARPASRSRRALRLARAAAIARNREVAVVIDVEQRTIEGDGLPVAALRAPTSLVELTIAEPNARAPSRGGFRFFADGSSTGGDIVLRLRGGSCACAWIG